MKRIKNETEVVIDQIADGDFEAAAKTLSSAEDPEAITQTLKNWTTPLERSQLAMAVNNLREKSL